MLYQQSKLPENRKSKLLYETNQARSIVFNVDGAAGADSSRNLDKPKNKGGPAGLKLKWINNGIKVYSMCTYLAKEWLFYK